MNETDFAYMQLEALIDVPPLSALNACRSLFVDHTCEWEELDLVVPLYALHVPVAASLHVPVAVHFAQSGADRFTVRIDAREQSSLYPRFYGELTVRQERRSSAAIVLTGSYRVPLWLFGRAVDMVLFRGIARESMEQLLQRLAKRIQEAAHHAESAYARGIARSAS